MLHNSALDFVFLQNPPPSLSVFCCYFSHPPLGLLFGLALCIRLLRRLLGILSYSILTTSPAHWCGGCSSSYYLYSSQLSISLHVVFFFIVPNTFSSISYSNISSLLIMHCVSTQPWFAEYALLAKIILLGIFSSSLPFLDISVTRYTNWFTVFSLSS